MTKVLESDPKFGYFQKPTKAGLIVKPNFEDNSKEIVSNPNIRITLPGERHLNVLIGSQLYQKEYTSNVVETSENELTLFFKIIKTQLQAVYSAYINGFKSQFIS